LVLDPADTAGAAHFDLDLLVPLNPLTLVERCGIAGICGLFRRYPRVVSAALQGTIPGEGP
jgi:hypothetical protein